MIEHVYDALAAILFSDWPKNSKGQPIVYNKAIKIWNLGDRDIKADGTPTITFQGDSSEPEEAATGLWEVTHAIQIEVKNQNTSPETTDRHTQEMSRLVFEFLKDRRRLWVMTQCPICLKMSLSPEHFLIEHANIFQPYVDDIVGEFETEWALTHTGPPPISELTTTRRAGLATEAFYRVYDAVRQDEVVANLPTKAQATIKTALINRLRPIRELYQAKLSGTASEGSAGKQLLGTGKWTWKAKEVYYQGIYGPDDNTPTAAWSV